jgi:cupin 2 domain-containing protein
MEKFTGNLFELPEKLPVEFELFEEILSNENFLIERIISAGQKTPGDKWLEQDRDEWVLLLQGEATISFENEETVSLKSGDHVFIPSNKKHRVEFTSSEPSCIWLAVHGKLNSK